MELGVRVELLGEEAGLSLLRLGVLFVRGQVKDQVGDDERLCGLVEPGDVLLAKAGEVDGFDLFGTTGISGMNTRSTEKSLRQLQTRTCFQNRARRLGE